ncbi:MAG: hypothetical protein ACKPKO_22945, partial [Candidatus Fonsibacter sp.]
SRFSISGMVAGGTLWVAGLAPAMVEPVLEVMEDQAWMGRVHEPLRIVVEPGAVASPGCTWVRMVSAEKGHDFQWLVDTGGDLPAEELARAIGRILGATVGPALVNAMHPDTGRFSDMVLIKIAAGQATVMRALADTWAGLHVAGRVCR